jgi:tRNA-splicing ligase RtcB
VSAKLKRLSPFLWELPVGYRPGMRVPGRIVADDALMEEIRGDESLEQVANAACLPGIVTASLAMPDMHFGYGLPIGGVVATRVEDGVVSPGGVGFDINCGVRLVRTRLHREQLADRGLVRTLVAALLARVPTGVGARGRIRLSPADEDQVLVRGARWAVEHGYGSADDLVRTESGGCLAGADPDAVSERARQRGRDQQGTLGSGNHFLEIQCVDEVLDEPTARAFGLEAGQVTVMIHSGSRGLGHQVCTDYLPVMEAATRAYGIELPDRQLACAPIRSPEGERYLAAMRCAANYAWANRQCLMAWAGEVLESVLGLGPAELGMSLVYDVAHNIVKFERHVVDGRERELAVHRKGATRAFPAGHAEVPAPYRAVGQPVVIPGDMGTGSWVLVGLPGAMAETFGSTCHGAGRRLSRHAALRAARGRSIERELEDRHGVVVRASGRGTLGEEMPEAYKNVTAVVDVVQAAGLARKVVRLKPLGVIKG